MKNRDNNFTPNKNNHKLFGSYFLEAGIISNQQLQEALQEQKNKYPYKKIGEILLIHGWLKQNTLNYFVQKIILPEREKQRKINLGLYYNQKLARANPIRINLQPEKVCKILLIMVMLLIFANLLSHAGAFILNQYSDTQYSGRLFRLDEESNIPTFYSAFSLGICSILLAIIAFHKQTNNSPHTKHWKFLSLLFFLFSIDEIAMMHEILSVLREPLNASGFFYFTWVIPAFIFLLVFTVVFISFLQSLPQKIRTLFMLSGVIYVGGAIGVEMIGGYHSQIYGENNFAYGMITTIEESLEMVGILVFIYSLLFYLQNYLAKIDLSISFKNKFNR